MSARDIIGGILEPGRFVVLDAAPEWGLGQIQSVAGDRITVNFENAGKRLINVKHAELRNVDPNAERATP
jgi:hypothetical protein